MASTAKQIVELRNPSLIGDSRLDDMIQYSTDCLRGDFKNQEQRAIALYTLHLYALESLGSTTGGGASALEMEKEGDLQRKFGEITTLDAAGLSITAFGRELLALQRMCFINPINRMMDIDNGVISPNP